MAKDFLMLLIGLGLLALVILALWFFIFKVKHLKTSDVYMIDGGVKTGKSLVSVYLAIRQYRRNRIKVFIANCLRRIANLFRRIRKKPTKALREKPMLYSNMPLRCVKYNKLDKQIILRQVRIPYMSVVLIDEASLLADSMLGMVGNDRKKFDELNEQLTLFVKLFGHYTHGGSLFWNTQAIVDMHFSFRRCTVQYLYLTKNRKFPFFCMIESREMVHSEDGDSVNSFTHDTDVDDKPLFIWKRYYKYYDRFYLSCLTDNLPLMVNYDVEKLDKKASCKPNEIVTFGNYKTIKKYNKEHEKKKPFRFFKKGS